MAVTGPAPKHPTQRRRSNTPERGEWIELDKPVLERDEIRLRELRVLEKVYLTPKARRIWAEWRKEPVTIYWTHSDVQFALATLELYSCSDWTRHAAEIRLREDRLSLTPKGKRDNRYRIGWLGGIGRVATKDNPPPPDETAGAEVVNLDERRQNLTHGA